VNEDTESDPMTSSTSLLQPDPVREGPRNLNPFLQRDEPSPEIEKDLMETDAEPSVVETNPFRKLAKDGAQP
jgi:hypothetical protein